jgi:hypothetical protein
MDAPQIPFNLPKREYTKQTKLPGLTNWMAKCNKKRGYRLVFEYWVATGPAEYRRGYVHSGGHGVSGGVLSNQAQKFEKRDITVAAVYFDREIDSWIVRDLDGKFHRAPWPNAYQNPAHPHHRSREEVEAVLKKCQELTIYS